MKVFKTVDTSIDLMFGNAPWYKQIPYDCYKSVKEFIFPPWRDNWVWKVRYWFNPRQKWIKKHIEYYSWCDKPELIKDFLFGCVVNFIEKDGEDCFNVVCWDCSDEHRKAAQELQDCYNYVKIRRPNLEKEMDDELDRASKKSGDIEWKQVKHGDMDLLEMVPSKTPYEECYGKYDELEKELDRLDTLYLTWIVQNRKWMWT